MQAPTMKSWVGPGDKARKKHNVLDTSKWQLVPNKCHFSTLMWSIFEMSNRNFTPACRLMLTVSGWALGTVGRACALLVYLVSRTKCYCKGGRVWRHSCMCVVLFTRNRGEYEFSIHSSEGCGSTRLVLP